METIILILTFIIEAAFATYCVVTKSDQNKIKNFVRIGAFSAFVLFTLVPVIQWTFRWYLLALLLFIWAALGVGKLISKKASIKEYRAGRSVTRAIGTLLLVFIAVIPALVFPQVSLPKPTGSHPVATATYTYTDASRIETFSKTGGNREVNVEFWYPQDGGGPYPLVIFSHGTGGMKTSNTSTFMDLASNGYVVCSIDHPYHSMITVDAAGRRTMIDQAYLQEYLAVTSGKYDDVTEFKIEREWVNLRVADINFVLDTVLQNAQKAGSNTVYQLIDPAEIGLMGHSLGGESSAQVARVRAQSGRNDISAVVNLDADLNGEYLGVQDGKAVFVEQPYPAPILNIFSDSLWNLMEKVPDATDVIAVKRLDATDPDAYEVHLTGTNHLSFTDMPLTSPFLVTLINGAVPSAGGAATNPYATIEKMNATILSFFNAYLKGEGIFRSAGTY